MWCINIQLFIFGREDSKVSHYIINKIQQGDQTRYRIGDQMFPDLPALLSFYRLHYLDTTPLIRPAPKRVERVIAKYDFDGSVSETLNDFLDFVFFIKCLSCCRTRMTCLSAKVKYWPSSARTRSNGGRPWTALVKQVPYRSPTSKR